MVDPLPPASATYQWNTTGCFTNDLLTAPTCFPNGQITQNVTDNNVTAEDAGTITCTATINGLNFTSGLLTLRISGMARHNVLYCNNPYSKIPLKYLGEFGDRHLPINSDDYMSTLMY